MSTLWSVSQGLNFELTLQIYDIILWQTRKSVKFSRKQHLVCLNITSFVSFCVIIWLVGQKKYPNRFG